MFAYIDGLSALSAEGYAQAQSAAAGETERRRRRLAALLLDPAASDEDAVAPRRAEAGWEPPERIAALAWAAGGRRSWRGCPPGSLVADPGDGRWPGLALLADPGGAGPRGPARAARRRVRPLVLGPVGGAARRRRRSAERARAALRLIDAGAWSQAPAFSRADDHLGALVAHGDERALAELAERRLAPLDEETPASRRRLTETLRSWLDHQGEVARVAAELHVHPQTVRYRLGAPARALRRAARRSRGALRARASVARQRFRGLRTGKPQKQATQSKRGAKWLRPPRAGTSWRRITASSAST